MVTHTFLFLSPSIYLVFLVQGVTFQGSSSERVHMGLTPAACFGFRYLVVSRWHAALIAVLLYF